MLILWQLASHIQKSHFLSCLLHLIKIQFGAYDLFQGQINLYLTCKSRSLMTLASKGGILLLASLPKSKFSTVD